MKIITKIIEETSVLVSLDKEEMAVEYLKDLGYHIINFDHQTDLVKIVGQRTFELKRGKNGNKTDEGGKR